MRPPGLRVLSGTGLALAGLHLALVIIVFGQLYEGSWGYIFFVLPDLPVMLPLILLHPSGWLSSNGAWIILGLLGSLWWYLAGAWLAARFTQSR